MSIKIPSISILDQLLHGLGKKRGLMVPEKAYEKYGPYAYVFARKESFWVALFRPKNKNLPEGLINLMEVYEALGNRTRIFETNSKPKEI